MDGLCSWLWRISTGHYIPLHPFLVVALSRFCSEEAVLGDSEHQVGHMRHLTDLGIIFLTEALLMRLPCYRIVSHRIA